MIIKKLNIHSFGKIQNITLDFTTDINLIYGENEKGKSTIQSFIKACLYGMPGKKDKGTAYSLRERYLSVSGEKMSGELTIEHENRAYIIKRTFGRTKKDDTSQVLDGLSGKEIKEVDSDEPGKFFLGVNSSTFSKTLFISQLGVVVEKDKEEEIMDKITNIFHSGDGEISIERGIEAIEGNIKSLTTARKVGRLDLLKNTREELLREKFEAYKISEETLDKEERLNKITSEKALLLKEIENLELYKKYTKKIKLQKEYKEIVEYLRKSEELKKQKNEILGSMKNGDNIIEEEYIQELTEENNNYLNLLDIKNEALKEIENKQKKIEESRELISKYEYFNKVDNSFKVELLTIKITQENLKEKILALDNIKKSIELDEKELIEKRKGIPYFEVIEKNSTEIIRKLGHYEEKLRVLQELGKNSKKLSGVEKKYKKIRFRKNLSLGCLLMAGVLLGVSSIVGVSGIVSVVGIIILGLSLICFIHSSSKEKELSKGLNEKQEIEELKSSILNIEKELMCFGRSIGAKNYEEVIYKLKSYENYRISENKLIVRIEGRKEELRASNLEEEKTRYEKNIMYIDKLLRETESSSIKDVIDKYNEYEKERAELNLIIKEYENRKLGIKRNELELKSKEAGIRRKLVELDLAHIELIDLSYHLKELRSKLKKKNEILSSLSSVEQTYSALIKERNIDDIKGELQEILDVDLKYTYENEEEIEKEIKKRSEELINREKEIRDLKNFIGNRFVGKREVSRIEEDLSEVQENIKRDEKRLKALTIAKSKMHEASLDIRKNIGPILNENIVKYMKALSEDSFEEVLLGEDYSMQIRKSGKLFPSEFLSNGAKDQLYLSLRLAFTKYIFEEEEYPIFFDDAFVQYDENRREKVLELISNLGNRQTLIFTCQKIEWDVLKSKNKNFNYITL